MTIKIQHDQPFMGFKAVKRDLLAGFIVFLVALPLCLGVAFASKVPLVSGLISGVIGGVVVGAISGSHTSVSGPAAGLTVIVAGQVSALGSYPTFLLALTLAGVIQICLGVFRAGFIAAFIPTSVINGLLAAIGVILVLKQFPHAVGHDADPEGEFAFEQVDHENTFSEILATMGDFHWGAAAVGILSILVLFSWDWSNLLKGSGIPSALIVAILGVMLKTLFDVVGGPWRIGASHLVQVPVMNNVSDFLSSLSAPDFSQWVNPAVYSAAIVITAVASLETLLNLEAVDRIDPLKRTSPPSRELLAQGIGNTLAGLIGGMPLTSVIVRSSVNINAGATSKLATIVHGILLMVSVVFLASWVNLIPLSSLAAILIFTGAKLAKLGLFVSMFKDGWNQFIPFLSTLLAIVFSDIVTGVLIGIAISIAFILHSNVRRPLRRVVERHVGGEVTRIELANQVSFLNRAVISEALSKVPSGSHLLIDARTTDYIDPDVLNLIVTYQKEIAPARRIEVSLLGFRERYPLTDNVRFVDHSNLETQSRMTPNDVLLMLHHGHQRFLNGTPLTRDPHRLIHAMASGQHPLAVSLSCADSRAPVELIFDVGVGDIFSVRIAGNVVGPRVLGSIEYGCVTLRCKVVMVMGHSKCGAVTAAIHQARDSGASRTPLTGHVQSLLVAIREVMSEDVRKELQQAPEKDLDRLVERVTEMNVVHSMQQIRNKSEILREMIESGQVMLVGGIYTVETGAFRFLSASGEAMEPFDLPDSARTT